MVRSLAALWRLDPGFAPDHAITFTLSLPDAASATSTATRARLRAFDASMRGVPGVEAVSITLGSRPMIHDSSLPFWIEGRPKPATTQEMPQGLFYLVEDGFQRAMGLTLLRGRFITAQDNEHAPVVIDIDETFARMYFPGENPVGRRVNFAAFDVQAEIVGVVNHLRQWGPGAEPARPIQAQFDFPFMQLPERIMPLVAESVAVVLRTAGDPTIVMPDVRRAVASLDPGEVIYNVQTLEQVVGNSFAARRLSMLLLAGFAALALLLASIGIYGVISYLVDQRAHEIGVRVALGASRRDILHLVVGHGARMAAVGIVLGTAGALALTRVMANQLFGVTAHDPATFAATAAILLGVALIACYLPARRASRLDPLISLGRE
jgi:predicted permease